ncbi:hypothetical protein QN277_012828 [Acacia crassicarpa]|uniref:Long-chain-alcohol oxidase n=1 Tax=Acacia crassicarpa TaxID=499986 RepID=A0AAE1TF01_9FABA|nr:hypothetical protein QN277_012828 [Acacia crassicarpa]
MAGRRSESHPLLSGRRREGGYEHDLSPKQMQVLAAICDAFLPPITHHEVPSHSPAIRSFYAASGSQAPFPDEAAELMQRRILPEAQAAVGSVLRRLSGRLGTLWLCGRIALDWRWPFVHKFSELSVEKREKILQKWCRENRHLPLRLTFLVLKICFFFTFFSRVDENGHNPAWEAIKYQVDSREKLKLKERPLEKGVVETIYESDNTILYALKSKGLEVTETADSYKIKCDVVVVGSGSGGGVQAAVLAAAGLKVVVLEKGNYFVPENYSSLEGPSFNEMYESGGIYSTLDAKLFFLAGATVGGGSSVNWSACIKTPDSVLREWSQNYKIPLYGTSTYRSAMERMWKRIGATQGWNQESFQNHVMRTGGQNIGTNITPLDRNSSTHHYCGSCGYGCRTGDKQGTELTFLVDAVQNGAVIITGCKAEKLIFQNQKDGIRTQKCSGVIAKALRGKVSKKIHIESKATVLACGALNTPPLMIFSGLRNPNIGRNLHVHPILFAWGYFPEEMKEYPGNNHEGGIMTSIHIANDENDAPKFIFEIPAFHPGLFSAFMPWVSGKDMRERMLKYGRTSFIFILARDRGTGEVLKEGRVSYVMNEHEKKNLRDGLRLALRILIGAGAVEVGTLRSDGQRMKCKGVMKNDVEEFLDSVIVAGGPMENGELWTNFATAHQIGSCRMGPTPEEGALDVNGESWEAKGLYASDGSVLPSAIGINPMMTIEATSYCIGHNVIESIKKDK